MAPDSSGYGLRYARGWTGALIGGIILKGILSLIALAIIEGIVSAVLPLGSISGTIGTLVALAAVAYWWVQTWPPWIPREEFELVDILKEIEDERLPTARPSDAARGISLLTAGADRFSDGGLRDLSIVIGEGISDEGDPERVLAQFSRIEDDSTGRDPGPRAIELLFEMYMAAEPRLWRRLWEKVRSIDADVAKDTTWRTEPVIKQSAAFAIMALSDVSSPTGWKPVLSEMMESDLEHVRGPAAQALGATARVEGDEAPFLDRLYELTDDRKKSVRNCALTGIWYVAIRSARKQEARDMLTRIADGPDPDLAEHARRYLERIAEIDAGEYADDDVPEQFTSAQDEEMVKNYTIANDD
jgi:hypothetical protein